MTADQPPGEDSIVVNHPIDMAKLARDVASAPDVRTTAEQVVQATAHATDSTDVGITLLTTGSQLLSYAPTSDAVTEADRLQHELTEGPCVDAALDQLTLWSGDLTTESRWSRWSPRAAALGLRSVLSVRLGFDDRRIGALNVYGRTPGEFEADSADLVVELAQYAAIALAQAGRVENLEVAMTTRNLIGQAQGILMERYGIDADRAFDVLRRHSQDLNIKLRTVAESLIDTSRLPEAPEETPDSSVRS